MSWRIRPTTPSQHSHSAGSPTCRSATLNQQVEAGRPRLPRRRESCRSRGADGRSTAKTIPSPTKAQTRPRRSNCSSRATTPVDRHRAGRAEEGGEGEQTYKQRKKSALKRANIVAPLRYCPSAVGGPAARNLSTGSEPRRASGDCIWLRAASKGVSGPQLPRQETCLERLRHLGLPVHIRV